MVTSSPLPAQLHAVCDEAIAAFKAGKPEPENFKQVTDWLEVDGWDALIADLGDQMAINLRAMGYD
jgi:hypothetical protein